MSSSAARFSSASIRLRYAPISSDPQVVEQPGGAADVELPVVLDRVERAADRVEERPLPLRERRIVERAAQEPRAEPNAGEPLAEVVRRPEDEARVDRLGEDVALLRDAAGRGDHDDHHHVRLKRQDLDVPDRRRLERRRRDEREQPRQLREHLGRRLQRLLDLGARGGEPERQVLLARLRAREQLVDVDAVAGLGRDPAGRGVRMGQQTAPLEVGKLCPDGRRRDVEAGPLDERLRADRLPVRDVLLDDPAKDLALPLGERGVHLALMVGLRSRRAKPREATATRRSPRRLPGTGRYPSWPVCATLPGRPWRRCDRADPPPRRSVRRGAAR